jgi:CsoR family transcriptional regulator, copper-sensing transcriptional repressor
MKKETLEAAVKRLARIEGQVIDQDTYCIDVVRQVQAVKAALSGLEALLLDDHLASCVEHALTSGDIDERRAKVEELVAVLGGRKK